MEEIPGSEFENNHFDAKKVVQHYRKLVPLPQLQRSLRNQHQAARHELVELINEKYADFVSLSSRMAGVERALKPLQTPLQDTSELTRNIRNKLGDILEQARDKQHVLVKTRAKKAALAAYIENAKILAKAKDSLERGMANPQESEDALREHVMHENIARDLRKIRLNLGGRASNSPSWTRTEKPPSQSQVQAAGLHKAQTSGGDGEKKVVEEPLAEDSSPECQTLLREAAEFEDIFARMLQNRLHVMASSAKRSADGTATGCADGYAPWPPTRGEQLAMAHVSRALVVLGRADVVETTFADVFVKNVLQEATNVIGPGGGSHYGAEGTPIVHHGASAVDLGPFFRLVQERLLAPGGALQWLASRLRTSEAVTSTDSDDALLAVPGLQLIAHSIAVPVLKHVKQVWEKSIFMPVFLDVFAANYTHASKFMHLVEQNMTQGERSQFSKSPVLSDFRRRWKTQVYFSLRQKQASKILGAVAARPLEPAALSDQRHEACGARFWLEASSELLRVIGDTWGEAWFLDVLYPKMVQLTLEVIIIYGKMLSNAAASHDVSCAWDNSSVKPSWPENSQPVRLSRIVSDLDQIISAISGDVDSDGVIGCVPRMMVNRLPRSPVEGGAANAVRSKEIVRKLLRGASSALQPVLQDVEDALTRSVIAAVMPQFAAIRGIPALYRMLNKPVPTKPSPYVESALRPINALKTCLSAQTVPSGMVDRWSQSAVDAAANEFASQAVQLLASTKQQEASMRRLGGRGGSAAGGSQVSDLDKIHIQLCVDVESFIHSARTLGAQPGDSESGLEKLIQAVAPVKEIYVAHRVPADQIQGAL